MPLRARVYIFLTVVAGAIVLGYGLWNWHSADWERYIFYLCISGLASGMKVTLSAGSGTMSMNFLFILIGIEALTLGETLVMGCVGILVQRFFHAHQRPSTIQVVFNVASMACSIGAAFATYRTGLGAGGWFEPPILLLLAAGTFFLTNTFSVALVIALSEKKSAWAVWRESYFWSFPNYLVGAAVAWGLGAVSRGLGWQVSLLALPVLFVIYRSHRLYVDRLKEEKGHAVEVAALYRRTVTTLAVAVEAKDPNTHDHLARVEVYAMAIGRELGLCGDELKALQAAALLHDIGKVAVSEHIISKPGKLTREEFEKMKAHSVVGAEMVEQIEFPYPVAPIVRAHHEKWDGSGYPDGLAGEDIPIGARILAAVDCLDALASDRPYRRALPLAEALAVVRNEAGTSYDPRVVEALSRRCLELEKTARASTPSRRTKLSTDVKVTRGAAPAAGFTESEDTTARDLMEIQRSMEASELPSAAPDRLSAQLEVCGSRPEAFAELRESLVRAVPYQVLVVYRRRGNSLVPEYLDGEGQDRFSSLEIPVGEGLAGWVAENSMAIVNGNPSVEPGYSNDSAKFGALDSALAVPLQSHAGVTGVLSLYRRERDAFQPQEMRLLLSVSAKLGHRLELLGQPQ